MQETHVAALSADERAIVDEEEAWLARARAAVVAEQGRAAARAREARRTSELRSIDALRALRDEAASASEDDLPQLLQEMHVRQRLVAREEAPLPDPDAPYFAHLRVREGRAAKDYLLGRASLLDGAVRIVDWRVAPVARVFYRYREGDAFEESFPGREVEGTVEARRIVVLDRGALVRIVADGVTLARDARGAWTRIDADRASALASGGAGTAVRPGALGVGVGAASGAARAGEITALLDAEQFAAIASPADRPLLVLGSAGSGKTTVALHRLARVATEGPSPRPLARTHVVVPEEGLARLSRRLLAPLGVGKAQVRTLDAWAQALAREVFGDALPKVWKEAPGLVTALKRHPALYDALRARFAALPAASTTLPKLRRRLADAFTDRAFLASVVDASRGTLPRSAIEETVRHTMLQLDTSLARELAAVTVPEMKRAVDGRSIAAGTPDAIGGTVDLEDLPILLFVRAWRGAPLATSCAHLVVDEAEDASLFELYVLGARLDRPPSVTLAGDEAQQTLSSFGGWSRALEAFGVSDAATCRLSVSYRCPRPVAEIARHVLGPIARADGEVRAARDGAPVGRFAFPEEAQAWLFVAGAIRDLADREPRASIGVLARDEETAGRFHALLADHPAVRHVRGGAFGFEPGVDVADVESAKGLEFDYVVLPDATADAYPATDDARRRLHVAITRASHQLWLVSGGAASPLLP